MHSGALAAAAHIVFFSGHGCPALWSSNVTAEEQLLQLSVCNSLLLSFSRAWVLRQFPLCSCGPRGICSVGQERCRLGDKVPRVWWKLGRGWGGVHCQFGLRLECDVYRSLSGDSGCSFLY